MLNVLIAEDDIPTSVQLLNTINTENVRCIGILNNCAVVYKKTKELNPDILLLNMKDGLSILHEIQEDRYLQTKIFIYSENMQYMALARNYKCVDRFFSKITPPEEISRELDEISEKISNEKLSKKIREILLQIGFDYTLKGTRYLSDCISYAVLNNEETDSKIYSEVSKEKGENMYTIKSNINTAIVNMWKFCNKEK